LLILKILALEPLHGWAIRLRLQQVSADDLQVGDGSLYPALHKLEQQGWIQSQWKMTENNRRASFYKPRDWAAASWRKKWPAGTGSLQPLRESSS
jgi:DNA-binding PadR family transcriptional regulator